MRHTFLLIITALLLGMPSGSGAQGLSSGEAGGGAVTTSSGPDISADYLSQARKYRKEGRYELARQSYTQALATCRTEEKVRVIRHELGGIELLLRTMR